MDETGACVELLHAAPPADLAPLVLRFNRALAMLEGGHRGLAAVALDSGACDQAPLNRDFRDFAGETPGAFLAR